MYLESIGNPSNPAVFYLCFREDNGFSLARLAGIQRFARLQSHKGTDNLKLNLKYCINTFVDLIEFSKSI